jgi:phosphoribosylaminoimidazolecarboxamide formyltransferase/IMP cyclohydrolase
MKAIISVFDKTGVAAFADALHERGIELIATEGTARELEKRGIPVTKVFEFTGSPELLGGKVKTLHPRIHAAIATGEICMVVVNLIPPGHGTENPLDTMDIGGVALLRSGIKNFEHTAVIVDSAQYEVLIEELKARGNLTRETNLQLAKEAIRYLLTYDSRIAMLLERLT